MPQFRSLLLPVHFRTLDDEVEFAIDSRKAFALATGVAKELGASLTMVHVFDKIESEPLSDDEPLASYSVVLGGHAAEAASQGVEIEWEFVFGNPNEEIIGLANSGEFDLLVMGTRQHVGDGGRLVGSTAASVMVASDVPVVIARSSGTGQHCAVIATDLTPECDKTLAHGLALSRGRAAEIHVVHACDDPSVALDESKLSPLRAKLELQLARGLDGDDPPSGLTTRVEFGTPANVIWTIAARYHADLVVMGMGGRTGAARVLHGNTAETVLEDLPCSLMTVRS